MMRVMLAAGAVALGVTAALAQANVIQQRQTIMKSNGDQARAVSGMLRGQAPFNLAQVQTALRTISENAKNLPTLWPENSKTGSETKALPAIWQRKADFEQRLTKLGQDAQAASAAIKDEATFKTEMPKVLQNCGGCHETYRQPTT
jgi:cytochrome c556